MSPEAFARAFDVSRETLARLEIFARVLETWTRRINLIAPSTVPELWSRHIADCAQLWPLRPAGARSWVDLGAGAGLPGLVIAALAAEAGGPAVTLVESDRRKAAFLATAAREMGLAPAIRAERIEALALPAPPEVISARALAPLPALLAHAARLGGPETVALFPKGARADSELTAAAERWHYHVTKIASRTDGNATILRLTHIRSIEQSHDPTS
ncbi:16S rRNA (guanine(527)-N(7))-methyltransferase RsmG [Paralimibaculum aggregatum]|uniref:Ribosomal RNA small subunit methyltransferase G n=1 Tax=Paralimibaculum aggregatum TaxID=3036245 RepID=A0ABQ6LSD6_9RHOB|nr:16S rRNA (guanine(527)-N(7))-methyltransferase RsmG [Limibaculum sp. NKW23]GMG84986.1 16S rRNA (guanine(527)-N(7))-methyltransferase RsmG [Limibaculum sp. NKW23]